MNVVSDPSTSQEEAISPSGCRPTECSLESKTHRAHCKQFQGPQNSFIAVINAQNKNYRGRNVCGEATITQGERAPTDRL